MFQRRITLSYLTSTLQKEVKQHSLTIFIHLRNTRMELLYNYLAWRSEGRREEEGREEGREIGRERGRERQGRKGRSIEETF